MPIAFVERDYWVTELHRPVVKFVVLEGGNDDARVVCRGGTSSQQGMWSDSNRWE